MDELVKPTTLAEMDSLCDKFGWDWQLDNYGGVVIYTGQRSGPKGLEDFDQQPCEDENES